MGLHQPPVSISGERCMLGILGAGVQIDGGFPKLEVSVLGVPILNEGYCILGSSHFGKLPYLWGWQEAFHSVADTIVCRFTLLSGCCSFCFRGCMEHSLTADFAPSCLNDP